MAQLAKGHRSTVLLHLVVAGQLPLWRRIARHDRTWRALASMARYWCLGCGIRRVHVKRTYCKRCRARLAANLPCDLDEHLTKVEVAGLRRRMPSAFMD